MRNNIDTKLNDIMQDTREQCFNIGCGDSEPAAECHDAVKHPSHYTHGKIECIDYILDKGLNFPLGNAVKYITRAGHKKSAAMDDTAKTIQDLRKAIQYIEFEIEHLEGKR